MPLFVVASRIEEAIGANLAFRFGNLVFGAFSFDILDVEAIISPLKLLYKKNRLQYYIDPRTLPWSQSTLIYFGESALKKKFNVKCESKKISYVCWKSRVKAFSKLNTEPRLSLRDFGKGV